MTIRALHHVQLAMPAGQEATARSFYAGVLGMIEVRKPEHLATRGGAWFRSGFIEIHLGVDPDFRAAQKAHPALVVGDLRQVADRCSAAGHRVTSDQPLPGFDRLYVDDPFGNRIELLEPSQQRHRSGRPKPGEYGAYAQSDFDHVAGDDAVDALVAAEAETMALFGSIDDERAKGLTYAAGKWTLKEVLGHLIDDERIFVYRALCVARGDTRELAGFDEKLYVQTSGFEQRTINSLLSEYKSVRESTNAFFGSLTGDQWLRRSVVNGYEASVRGLAFHIAAHELHHLRIVREKYLK